MPAVAWLRQKTIGSLAAGSVSSRSAWSSPSLPLCAYVVARSSKSDVIIPAPTAQPQRAAVSAVGRMPASRNACSAAASAKRCERLANFRRRRSTQASASKCFTSAAMWTGKPLASKRLISAPPLRPASSASHVVATSLPTGVTRPMPVIATRRRRRSRRFPSRSTSRRAVAAVLPSMRAASLSVAAARRAAPSRRRCRASRRAE